MLLDWYYIYQDNSIIISSNYTNTITNVKQMQVLPNGQVRLKIAHAYDWVQPICSQSHPYKMFNKLSVGDSSNSYARIFLYFIFYWVRNVRA